MKLLSIQLKDLWSSNLSECLKYLFLFKINVFKALFRICISFHADLDPGSQKCTYGTKLFKMTLKRH